MPKAVPEESIGSSTIVEKLLQPVSRAQLKRLIDLARSNSGEVVGNAGLEPGDELCPNFYFPLPFTPKFPEFLQHAVALGRVRLVGSGIINPEGVFVQVGLGKIK
jgi:hypothetical protein